MYKKEARNGLAKTHEIYTFQGGPPDLLNLDPPPYNMADLK